MYILKWQNIVESKSNMFARVNENKNMLNKQFDGNWLCDGWMETGCVFKLGLENEISS